MVWLPTPRLTWSLWNTTELPLPNTMSLQMQSAHRSLSQKTGPDAAPTSSPVKDLTVKETSLKLAWKKEVININKIFFDHDYAYELTEKRRVYRRIKKVLEERERCLIPNCVHRDSDPPELQPGAEKTVGVSMATSRHQGWRKMNRDKSERKASGVQEITLTWEEWRPLRTINQLTGNKGAINPTWRLDPSALQFTLDLWVTTLVPNGFSWDMLLNDPRSGTGNFHPSQFTSPTPASMLIYCTHVQPLFLFNIWPLPTVTSRVGLIFT